MMKKSLFAFFVIILLGIPLLANDVMENLFPDPSFRSWKETAERRFTTNGGENGTPGLIVERKDPKVFDYKFETVTAPMKPNTRYEISFRVKTKDVSSLKMGANVRLEFRNKGKWVGAFMRRGIMGTTPWTTVRYEVTTPAEFDTVWIGFFLGMPFPQPENQLGYAVFCQPILRELKPLLNVDLLNPPLRHGLRNGKNHLLFNYSLVGADMKTLPGELTAIFTGATQQTIKVPVKDGYFAIDCNLNKGDSQLELKFGEFTKTFQLTAGLPMPPNATWIDEKGRVVRNGKPFLPVGILINQACPTMEKYGYVTLEEDIKRFIESPFNLYHEGMLWRTRFEGEEAAGRWGDITEKTLANAIKLMDRIHAAGKTVSIPFRPLTAKNKALGRQGIDEVGKLLIDTFASHPATLVWYLNDETDISAEEVHKREFLAKGDPFHPSLQVQCKIGSYAEAIGCGDIFAEDYYPIFKEDSTLEPVVKAMDEMNRVYSVNGYNQCWAIPQIFNWNNYDKSSPYYFPKEEQLRANIILMALSGIKGYAFYQWQWLREGVDKAGYEERWKMVCRLAQMLRDLEPWLLTDQNTPDFQIKVVQGAVRAQAFKANDGRLALLVANVGKGEGIAEITLPGSEKLSSLYGLTKKEGGKWIFKGVNAAGDVIR